MTGCWAAWIVPVSRLSEFESARRACSPVIPTTIHGSSGALLALLLEDDPLESQIERILQFNQQHAGGGPRADAIIDVVELWAANVQSMEQALDLLPEEIYPLRTRRLIMTSVACSPRSWV